ncbi:5310_t:CDS:2, partial [Cetraspora pellucida]
VGNYVDLHKFAYANLKTSLKNNDEEQTLQTSEGGIIAVRKRNCILRFNNISEWLPAFRTYMEAVLIIYDIREQEFNAYRLTTNYDSTLLDRSIEAEGDNFNVTTTKQHRNSITPQAFSES